MIELKLNDAVLTLNTHEVEGQTLYKAQDLLQATTLDSKKKSNLLSNWKISMEEKAILDFQVSVRGGKAQGTYLTKRNLLKLAAYYDPAFEDAVFEAFEALVEGRVEEAVEAATSVVNIRPCLRSGKHLKPALEALRETCPHPYDFILLVLAQSKALTDKEFDKLYKAVELYLIASYSRHYGLPAAMIELKHRKGDRYSRAAKLRK